MPERRSNTQPHSAEQARQLAEEARRPHYHSAEAAFKHEPCSGEPPCRIGEFADALEASLAREAAYRVEADHAMRDYEDLEALVRWALEELQKPNRRRPVEQVMDLLTEGLEGAGPRAALAAYRPAATEEEARPTSR